jgi:hypothetical protein
MDERTIQAVALCAVAHGWDGELVFGWSALGVKPALAAFPIRRLASSIYVMS